jgi:hypothetical protein
MNFKSKLEEWCWSQIQKLKPRRTKAEYETTRLPFVIQRYYLPDFIIILKDGTRRYIEAKGYFRSDDRTKLLAVKQAHPQADIRIVFSQDNKLTKRAKSKYSDWCKKNGFLYSIGSIPSDWLK